MQHAVCSIHHGTQLATWSSLVWTFSIGAKDTRKCSCCKSRGVKIFTFASQSSHQAILRPVIDSSSGFPLQFEEGREKREKDSQNKPVTCVARKKSHCLVLHACRSVDLWVDLTWVKDERWVGLWVENFSFPLLFPYTVIQVASSNVTWSSFGVSISLPLFLSLLLWKSLFKRAKCICVTWPASSFVLHTLDVFRPRRQKNLKRNLLSLHKQ